MRHLKYSIIFYLYINTVIAQTLIMQDFQSLDFGEENKQLSQKFKMAYYLLSHPPIIQRIESSENREALSLMKTAQSNYQLAVDKVRQQNWLEANAIIDYVLRDVTTLSQLLSKKSISQNLYNENLKRVEAFILPEWSELSPDDHELLNKISERINSLLDQAKKHAEAQEYDQASSILHRVYNLKTKLLQKLKHESTVVYGLRFDTPEEEYDYMLKRNQHFLDLVEKVLNENTFHEQTLKLIDVYLERSKAATKDARIREESDQHETAIQILDQSIRDLSSALIIMGIRI